MRRFTKIGLPLLMIALMAMCAIDAQAKTKKQPRTIYYVTDEQQQEIPRKSY